MDYPFDKDGNLTSTARTVIDTDDFFRTYREAEAGDADAQYLMGVWHLDGSNKLAHKDKKAAQAWLAKATDQGHEKAKKVLEQITHNNSELEHLRCYICLAGLEKYFPCYDECDKTAQMRRKEVEECQKKGEHILKEAGQGGAEAQLNAGYAYEDGIYLPKNYTKAIEWWIKSAEQGNAEAQNRLGFYYANGKGVEKDCAKAFEWYSKAAEQGNAYAQCKLGKHYFDGEGVTKDFDKAAEWYQKAIDQGDTLADHYLGELSKGRR